MALLGVEGLIVANLNKVTPGETHLSKATSPVQNVQMLGSKENILAVLTEEKIVAEIVPLRRFSLS